MGKRELRGPIQILDAIPARPERGERGMVFGGIVVELHEDDRSILREDPPHAGENRPFRPFDVDLHKINAIAGRPQIDVKRGGGHLEATPLTVDG
jgi:hypothetical protein